MANAPDLNFTYSTIDNIFRLSFGEHGDFSGAWYNGDFSISLEQAQSRKHQFITEALQLKPGDRMIDLGCGWGPLLSYVRKKSIKGVGLTLSERQQAACRKNGLDVHVADCRIVTPEQFGMFDAASCIGAFEHFCSLKDFIDGKQDSLYHDFFAHVAQILPTGGRLFLQTMVFGKNMLPYEQMDINADKNSDAYILALMMKQFPGSWLPYGKEHVVKNASPFFKLLSESSGRLDYIETIRQWRKKFRAFNLKKYWIYLSLFPKYFYDDDFRHRVNIFRISPNKICFERELFDHWRLVFEKV